MLGDVPIPTLTDVNRAVHDIVECIEVSFVTRDYHLAYLLCIITFPCSHFHAHIP